MNPNVIYAAVMTISLVLAVYHAWGYMDERYSHTYIDAMFFVMHIVLIICCGLSLMYPNLSGLKPS